MKNIDEILREEINKETIDFSIIPLFSFQLFGVLFSMYKRVEFSIDILETNPYTPDGDFPLIFLDIGFISLTFESKRIYKYLYKKKYGEELNI